MNRFFLFGPAEYLRDIRKGDALSDTLVYVMGLADCYPERAVLGILESFIAAPALRIKNQPRIQVNIIDNSQQRFMRAGEGEVRTELLQENWLFVSVPRELLWHSEMSYELLAFMILHELGHGMDTRATAGSLASEALADHWAAHVALPAMFGVQAAASMRMRIARDFEAYLRTIYTSGTFNRASGPRSYVDAYPAMSCRIEGIRYPFYLDRDSLIVNGYPSECWHSTTGPINNASSSWQSGSCMSGLNCISYQASRMCSDPRLAQTIESPVTRYVEGLFSLCATRPDLCPDVNLGETSSKPSSKEARTIARSLGRAQKKLDSVRKEPGKNEQKPYGQACEPRYACPFCSPSRHGRIPSHKNGRDTAITRDSSI
ncbi:MAG: hypothetical protein IPJ85_08020 [Flavobacteriales bacterium]|nr:hypothetical protein [Flavobacteriales bacterium]